MYRSFTKRIAKFGIINLLISIDTLGFIASLILIGLYTNWNIDFTNTGKDVLDLFITVSSTFFSIILAGLAIISSFTDKEFILAWINIGQYENIVTLFQYNLFIPLVLLMFAFILRFICYNSVAMIILISLFVYMILSLVDLVKFIATYALQRGDFIKAKDDESQSK